MPISNVRAQNKLYDLGIVNTEHFEVTMMNVQNYLPRPKRYDMPNFIQHPGNWLEIVSKNSDNNIWRNDFSKYLLCKLIVLKFRNG